MKYLQLREHFISVIAHHRLCTCAHLDLIDAIKLSEICEPNEGVRTSQPTASCSPGIIH